MNHLHRFKSAWTYRTATVTIVIVALYAALFAPIFSTDTVPDIPEDQHGLDLDQAYIDLHKITALPHPYHSHANDIVRSYIRSRVDEITAGYDFVHVEEDFNTTIFRLNTFETACFQASNILVKIDGYDSSYQEIGGVLFSAHYDSVATAPGATDDGVAVVSLLQFINHLIHNRPRRTAIFNINNGEEDGLNGARAFTQHAWSTIPDYFINVEGAGAGGPPLLFRASSIAPVRAFLGKGLTTNTTTYRVPRPHGNVLSADAFERGVVRSATDYSIYNQNSRKRIEGIDLAFYKQRSRYHTMLDSVPNADGKGKEALWAMLENIWGAGGVLLNSEAPSVTAQDAMPAPTPSVYFDLFKRYFFVFEQSSLYIFNVVFLTVGPASILFIYLALPWYCGHFDASRHNERQTWLSRLTSLFGGSPRRHDEIDEEVQREGFFRAIFSAVRRSWAWGNFWIPTFLFTSSLILHILNVKEYHFQITYSHPNTVFLSILSLGFIILSLILRSPLTAKLQRSPQTPQTYTLPDRQNILLHLYVFTYFLLILATAALSGLQVGGLYWISAWHAGICSACIVGGVEAFYARNQWKKDMEKVRLRLHASQAGQYIGLHNGREETDDGDDASEETPLLPDSEAHHEDIVVETKEDDAWWILQVLLSVPIPVVMVGHILVLFQSALGQTLSDGSSAAFVYGAVAFLSFLIILPIAPFVSKIHHYVTYAAIVTFIVTSLYNLSAFPFSREAPLKVFFKQSLQVKTSNVAPDLSATNNTGEVIRAITSITGVREHIEWDIVTQLPSSWRKILVCSTETSGRWIGLDTCSWDSGADMMPYPGGSPQQPWLSVSAERTGDMTIRIEVKGKNARACRDSFDERQIVTYSLSGDEQTPRLRLTRAYPGVPGSSIKFWSREWGKQFAVEIELYSMWAGKPIDDVEESATDDGLVRGRIACEWAEYETGMIGLDLNELEGRGFRKPQIPALEEVFRFLPPWATVSKTAEGLVEAWSEFVV
ncbi:hypothetical protein AMATHDRAFT_157929 [Amanita thiersii Skay4041]|uniref:Peptide hydrolase n=1 Tax=Amanita thiersii Skay4041 TaxID=703135 RepID=A0A2A9NBX2_9AGAR|nr:hypothetical protein AMATHDRAFT_157929 [Amanita thiersii Skay4041]